MLAVRAGGEGGGGGQGAPKDRGVEGRATRMQRTQGPVV